MGAILEKENSLIKKKKNSKIATKPDWSTTFGLNKKTETKCDPNSVISKKKIKRKPKYIYI